MLAFGAAATELEVRERLAIDRKKPLWEAGLLRTTGGGGKRLRSELKREVGEATFWTSIGTSPGLSPASSSYRHLFFVVASAAPSPEPPPRLVVDKFSAMRESSPVPDIVVLSSVALDHSRDVLASKKPEHWVRMSRWRR